MKNNKLMLVLKIVSIVLCAALIMAGSICIATLVMQDDIDALQEKLDGASADIADIKGKYEAALMQIDALKDEQAQAKGQIEEISGELNTTKQELSDLLDDMNAFKADVNAELESLKAEIEASKGEDKRIRIYIDQGHNPTGYDNAGASGNGYYEQDITFVIGKLLAELLESDGRFVVCLSRPFSTTVLGTDNNSSLDARVEGAKEFDADYFISLHTNGYGDPAANGIEIYTVEDSGESYRFGNHLRPYLISATNLRDRGMKQTSTVRVLNNATMPAILIEMGFISNPDDAALMVNHPEVFAEGIYNGILSYFDFAVPTAE